MLVNHGIIIKSQMVIIRELTTMDAANSSTARQSERLLHNDMGIYKYNNLLYNIKKYLC